jgi:hypothetical protein
MTKPSKKIVTRYDYNECSEFLEKKYGYDERDYAARHKFWSECEKKTNKKFGKNGWYTTPRAEATPEQIEAIDYHEELLKAEPPYLDFWHFIIDHNEIHNDCDFVMYKELMDDAEPWQREILQHYFDEFDPDDTGEIEFHVWW